MRYRVLSASNTLIITSFFTGLGILLAVLCVVGGISSDAYENSAIATFDTSALSSSLASNSSASKISEWYSLHLTTVCHGSWTPSTLHRPSPATKEKNNATMICDPHGLSWTFALGTSLFPTSSPTSASPLSALDALYTANLSIPNGLLLAGISTSFLALLAIFASSFKHGFGPSTHAVCVAGVALEFLSAVLVLAAAGTLTVARGRLVRATPTVEGVEAFTSGSYLVLLWVAAVVPFVAGLVGIVGQHKEKRMHEVQPRLKPVKVPSISTTGSSGSGGSEGSEGSAGIMKGRNRGLSLASGRTGGRKRGDSNVAIGYGSTGRTVPTLKLAPASTQSSLGSAGSGASADGNRPKGKGRERRESLPPTSGSFGGRRYGV